MGVDHTLDIVINVTLASAPVSQAGFQSVLLLVDEATNTLNGDRYRSYSSPTGAQADQTSGYISAATLNAITAAFAQRPRPTTFLVGRVDTVGLETYSDGLAAVRALTDDFFAVCVDTRTAATQVALATTIESLEPRKLLVLQSDDADWLTSGVPAAYSTVAAYENTAVLYHDTSAQWADVAWAAKATVPNPDRKSGAWPVPLKGVQPYATGLTETERPLAIANNANLVGVMGPEPLFVSRGVNMVGRPLHELLTSAWLTIRLKEALAALIAEYGNRNDKLETNQVGMAVAVGRCHSVFQRGLSGRHFEEYEIPQQIVLQADRDAGRLVISDMQAIMPNTTTQFTVNVDASRTPIADA